MFLKLFNIIIKGELTMHEIENKQTEMDSDAERRHRIMVSLEEFKLTCRPLKPHHKCLLKIPPNPNGYAGLVVKVGHLGLLTRMPADAIGFGSTVESLLCGVHLGILSTQMIPRTQIFCSTGRKGLVLVLKTCTGLYIILQGDSPNKDTPQLLAFKTCLDLPVLQLGDVEIKYLSVLLENLCGDEKETETCSHTVTLELPKDV